MPAQRVYRRHLTALGYCARDSREFFKKHGFAWGQFLREGIEREKLVGTGDGMALKAVQVADAENGR